MDTDTTRRQLLRVGTSAAAYAAGAAIVAGGVAVATQAKGEAAAISPGLAKLLADYDRHDAQLDQFYETVWNPAIDAHRAALDRLEAKALKIEVPAYRNTIGETTPSVVYSSANKLHVNRCRGIVSIPSTHQSNDPRWQATYQAAIRIARRSKAEDRMRQWLEQKYNVAALAEQEDQLSQPLTDINGAIRGYRCASVADLRAKLTHLERIGLRDADGGEALDLVIAGLDSIEGRA